MKIQAISPNFTSQITKTQEEPKTQEQKCVCASCQDALAQQNKVLINKLEEFDPQSLDDFGILETFDKEELMLPTGRIAISELINLSSGSTSEQIRYYENFGELIPYMAQQYSDQAQQMGLNKEQTEQFLKEKEESFVKKYNEDKIKANESVELTAPTTKEHTVYRVIRDHNHPYGIDYFKKIRSLKKGENIKLDTVPIYVSTSGKRTMKNYCGRLGNAILFQIELPKGSKIFKFPTNDGIEQCIMKADSEFEVLEHKEYKDNFRLIKLKYLP